MYLKWHSVFPICRKLSIFVSKPFSIFLSSVPLLLVNGLNVINCVSLRFVFSPLGYRTFDWYHRGTGQILLLQIPKFLMV